MNSPVDRSPAPSRPLAVVTGAGSGVGRACVFRLVAAGWRVALVGRHEATLRDTAKAAIIARSRLCVYPCDISDAAAVTRLAGTVLRKSPRIDALINAAGTNIPPQPQGLVAG